MYILIGVHRFCSVRWQASLARLEANAYGGSKMQFRSSILITLICMDRKLMVAQLVPFGQQKHTMPYYDTYTHSVQRQVLPA